MKTPSDKVGLDKQIDDVVFRCFEQGRYWGTGIASADGHCLEDYEPDKPIDRGEANRLLQNVVHQKQVEARVAEVERLLPKKVIEKRKDTKIICNNGHEQGRTHFGDKHRAGELRQDAKDRPFCSTCGAPRTAIEVVEEWESVQEIDTLNIENRLQHLRKQT